MTGGLSKFGLLIVTRSDVAKLVHDPMDPAKSGVPISRLSKSSLKETQDKLG
jgi:hypothetical protein